MDETPKVGVKIEPPNLEKVSPLFWLIALVTLSGAGVTLYVLMLEFLGKGDLVKLW